LRRPRELGFGQREEVAGLARAGGTVIVLERSDARETRQGSAIGQGRRASCQRRVWATTDPSTAWWMYIWGAGLLFGRD
jgi:hypothetical protein